jgi:peptidyl-prolyl cis-trans isomerase B (cyclophilin B)
MAMAVRSERRSPRALVWLAAGLLGLGGAGCGKSSDAPARSGVAEEATAEFPHAAPASPAAAARLHRSFLQATRKLPPPDQRPPDRTRTGKSVGKLYSEVVRLWDTIRFAAPDGTRIGYAATLATDLGDIEIALNPDLAPNHVRNFIALARVGYYDGLVFDRVDEEDGVADDGKPIHYEGLQAGCPLGEGSPANNSIGYWLNPEFDRAATHEEGTVGACHGLHEADTAACKFYITLCRAPYLDGKYTVFGKVTRGLDVARKIFVQPALIEDDDGGSHRPLNPVVIRKVTIHSSEASKKKEAVSRR